MKTIHLIAVVPIAVLAACSKPIQPAADPAEVLDAIHKVESAQVAAFAKRDIEAGLAPYAERSAFAQSGAYLDGKAAIRPAFEAMLADPASKLELKPKGSFVSSSGDLAVTTADYAFTFTDPQKKQVVTETGVNQSVWQKQADGSWKNLSDFNVPTGPAALAKTE